MERTLLEITDPSAVVLVRQMLADGTARDLRLRSGLSLDAVARPVGITAGALWKWETGMRVPRVGEAAVRYGQLLAELLALDEV